MQLNWMTPALKLRPFPQKSALMRRRFKRRLPRSLHCCPSPFVGARIRLGGPGSTQETFTDASGYYRFLAPTVLGSQIVLIDGHTANTETTRYASAIAMPVLITAGQDNLVLTSYMSPVDVTKQVTIVPGTQAAVTMPDLPNFSLNIPAGATLFGCRSIRGQARIYFA